MMIGTWLEFKTGTSPNTRHKCYCWTKLAWTGK